MSRSVLVIVLLLISAGYAESQIPQIEREALIALYESTDGDNWDYNSGWLGPAGTECSWRAVYCDGGNVTVVNFDYGNNLKGSIPPELGNLSELETLRLAYNQLSGSIPPELGTLSNLRTLQLASNQLSGNIPPELGNLSNLTQLRLEHNQLSGNIPPELGNLSELEHLLLTQNQLTGSIPPELGNLSNLVHLYLNHNQLGGSIPPELADLSSLTFMYLKFNQLSGTIPLEFARLSVLRRLSLTSNQLTGAIPPGLGDLTALKRLELSGNHLGGTIPADIGNLTMLTTLELGSNQLVGTIPPELGNLPSLYNLTLGSNQLSGDIPVELGDLPALRNVSLDSNRLSGTIPPGLCGDSLTLYSNQLRGRIPPNLLYCDYLRIGFNALWTDDPYLQSHLDNKDPGWDETQTIAPEELTVLSVEDRTVWLAWTPISYTEDDGGYQVLSEQLPNGAVVPGGFTFHKLESAFPVTGLQPGQTHHLTVSTFTRPHANNQNLVMSDPGAPVMATTGDTGCATPTTSVSGNPNAYTLTVTSTHDGYEWVTGDTSSSVVVSPPEDQCFWVRTFGPGSCQESAVVCVPQVLFKDGFESGNTTRWSATVPPGSSFANGLVSYWDYDDGVGSSVVSDKSGANHGALINMNQFSDWETGKFGYALGFDGIDDYIDFGNHWTLDVSEGLTVSAWITISDRTGIHVALSKNTANDNRSWQLIASHDDNVFDPDAPRAAVILANGGGGGEAMVADLHTSPPVDVWSHLVMTYDIQDGALRFYVNGTEDTVSFDPLLRPIQISNADLVAGARSNLSRFFQGQIDDVALWRRALTPGEITQIWNGGAGNTISDLLTE